MISVEDCIGMCGVDPLELAAIAEHEHIPEIAATALASFLVRRAGGPAEIRRMIVEDIRDAVQDGRLGHAQELLMALRHFLDQHPEAAIADA